MAAKESSDGVRQRKGATTTTTPPVGPPEDDDQNIPEDVRKVKEKLEKETGKKYRYRPKDEVNRPSVPSLLTYGTGRPLTWTETILYPTALALLFAVTLIIFHHTVLVPSRNARLAGKPWREPYKLPKMVPPTTNRR
jgi:hypothetical protein